MTSYEQRIANFVAPLSAAPKPKEIQASTKGENAVQPTQHGGAVDFRHIAKNSPAPKRDEAGVKLKQVAVSRLDSLEKV